MSTDTLVLLVVLSAASGGFGIALIASGIAERRKMSLPPAVPSGGPRDPGPILKY